MDCPEKKREEKQLENYAVEMLHITKRFPGIVANDDVSIGIRKGEVYALLGENGVKITAVYNRDVDALLESLGKRKNVSYVKSGVLYLKEVRS